MKKGRGKDSNILVVESLEHQHLYCTCFVTSSRLVIPMQLYHYRFATFRVHCFLLHCWFAKRFYFNAHTEKSNDRNEKDLGYEVEGEIWVDRHAKSCHSLLQFPSTILSSTDEARERKINSNFSLLRCIGAFSFDLIVVSMLCTWDITCSDWYVIRICSFSCTFIKQASTKCSPQSPVTDVQ